MRRKNLDPLSPEVHARILKRIEQMSPDEALAFLTFRKPGVPLTDMTGMFRECPESTPEDAVQHAECLLHRRSPAF